MRAEAAFVEVGDLVDEPEIVWRTVANIPEASTS
jgi:hypothetical protein